jgi:hypothetical protein
MYFQYIKKRKQGKERKGKKEEIAIQTRVKMCYYIINNHLLGNRLSRQIPILPAPEQHVPDSTIFEANVKKRTTPRDRGNYLRSARNLLLLPDEPFR